MIPIKARILVDLLEVDSFRISCLKSNSAKNRSSAVPEEACVGALREPAGLVSAFPGAMQFEYGM